MIDLIQRLNDLGDAKHDDLSVAHEAAEELMRLKRALVREAAAELIRPAPRRVFVVLEDDRGNDPCVMGVFDSYEQAERCAGLSSHYWVDNPDGCRIQEVENE